MLDYLYKRCRKVHESVQSYYSLQLMQEYRIDYSTSLDLLSILHFPQNNKLQQ